MNPFVVLPYRDKACVRALNKTIDFLTKQIEQLEAELAEIASAEFDKQLKTLTSIKGIGITLATSLILTTGGFTYFDNAKQLSRFIGICPTYQQSGTSVNIKGHINRNGDENTAFITLCCLVVGSAIKCGLSGMLSPIEGQWETIQSRSDRGGKQTR